VKGLGRRQKPVAEIIVGQNLRFEIRHKRNLAQPPLLLASYVIRDFDQIVIRIAQIDGE